jgi:hypothetical protein
MIVDQTCLVGMIAAQHYDSYYEPGDTWAEGSVSPRHSMRKAASVNEYRPSAGPYFSNNFSGSQERALRGYPFEES